jgi:signal transduction histidine kinase
MTGALILPTISHGSTEPDENESPGYILRNISLGAHTLILGISTYFVTELLEGLGGGLLIGLGIVLLVGAGAGVAMGRRTEHRLVQLSTTLQDVAKGNLVARVPLTSGNADDLTQLSAEINKTIGHLQNMVESQNQISADIAHDLRTPMQRLRQRLEAIGQSPDLPLPQATAVYEAIDAADDLIETFHALLRISQIEAGARRENFCQVDLVSVMARIEDAYGAVAEEKGQSLTFTAATPPMPVSGDRQLLTQMMANVVENALRHYSGDAQIQVGPEVQNATVTFVVCDNGPGIPAPEKEKVLRRFYRLEKSRTTSGNGLGLSLVRAVADLHDAKLSLTVGNPGLTVSIVFTASPKGSLWAKALPLVWKRSIQTYISSACLRLPACPRSAVLRHAVLRHAVLRHAGHSQRLTRRFRRLPAVVCRLSGACPLCSWADQSKSPGPRSNFPHAGSEARLRPRPLRRGPECPEQHQAAA